MLRTEPTKDTRTRLRTKSPSKYSFFFLPLPLWGGGTTRAQKMRLLVSIGRESAQQANAEYTTRRVTKHNHEAAPRPPPKRRARETPKIFTRTSSKPCCQSSWSSDQPRPLGPRRGVRPQEKRVRSGGENGDHNGADRNTAFSPSGSLERPSSLFDWFHVGFLFAPLRPPG